MYVGGHVYVRARVHAYMRECVRVPPERRILAYCFAFELICNILFIDIGPNDFVLLIYDCALCSHMCRPG